MKITGVVLLGILHLASAKNLGWAKKRGEKWKTWKRRWFVLSKKTKTITYYSQKSADWKYKKGCIHFEPDDVHPTDKDGGLEIKTPTRTWQLVLETAGQRPHWLKAIREC